MFARRAAVASLVLAACGAPPADPTDTVELITFEGRFDANSQQLTIASISSAHRGLVAVPVTRDGSGPDGTVELVTVDSGVGPAQCDGVDGFCGTVRLGSFFDVPLRDVLVEISTITPPTGNHATNGLGAAPVNAPNASATFGLFDYPDLTARSSADRRWVFAATGVDVAFRGRVLARVGSVADRSFTAPVDWAEPIADYIAAGAAAFGGAFSTAILDLAVHDDRLFIGYGDANRNMGSLVPIELRSFADPSSPIAAPEFATDEEEVRRFRVVDGALFVAGVDPTEDAFTANVYDRAGGAWTKHRTVPDALHVHDAASFGGAWYVVGSGSTPAEYAQEQVHARLWRSTDGGATFTIVDSEPGVGGGDARWYRCLPIDGQLWLFGYKTDATFAVNETMVATFDGVSVQPVAPTHPLASALVLDADALSPSMALVRGLVAGPMGWLHRSWVVDGVSATPSHVGRTVLDVFDASGESLVMSVDGEVHGANPGSWAPRIDVFDGATSHEVLGWATTAEPRSFALWRDRIYVGTEDGRVLQTAPGL